MKVTNLKIGNTYYMPIVGNPYEFKRVVLEDIIGKTVIVKDDKGKIYKRSCEKLHNSPSKAVNGQKTKQRVRHTLDMMEQKEKEQSVDKSIQRKIKTLGKKTYAYMDRNNKYIVCGYSKQISFNTAEELERFADTETAAFKEYMKKLNECKLLQIRTRNGKKKLYKIISISCNKFEIRIEKTEYTGDIGELKVLEKEEISTRFSIIQNRR